MKSPRSKRPAQATGLAKTPATVGQVVGQPRSERSRVIDRLEQIITQDIGGRGLALDPSDNLVTRCRGNLARAARHLAEEGNSVAIVTGFFIASAARPAIETDGPCGAIALAWLLSKLGYAVTLVTDPLGARVVDAGLHAARLGELRVSIAVFPFEDDDTRAPGRGSNDLRHSQASLAFTEAFFRSGPGEGLTHLVSVERAGPSHLSATQQMLADHDALDHQNHVHNFRGQIITAQTAKTHLLFDFIRENSLPVRTIGIGDGGNEIGMGSIPWPVIHANIASGLGARIACRVATDWTIACGVSNWGAYALGSAVACLRGHAELLNEWTDERERSVLAALVEQGAVDGVTAKSELSVDGLPIEQHLAIWEQIRDAARQELTVARS